jgi:hypothetical protein
MKARIVCAALATSAILVFASMRASGQPKGDSVSLKGEVIDVWCYLEGGDHGADHKACAVACAKAGNPIGLLTDKGDVYVLVGIKDHDPAKDQLIDKIAATVTVDGTLVKKGGIQAIYVSSVK